MNVLMADDETLVVGEHQRGEGQGDNHAQHSHQRAPDGEGEQDDGGVQSGDFPHHARYDEAVLNGLYNGEHRDGGRQNQPEVAARVRRFQDGEQDGGHEAYDLQVGNQVQQSDEHPQSDGERKVDDEEADAEQDTHAQRHERLSAEISVHALLHVVQQAGDEGAVFLRYQVNPAAGDAFVVQQDEDDVEQNQEDGEDAEQQADGLGQQRPQRGHRLLDGAHQAPLAEQLEDELRVDVLFQELGQRRGHVAVGDSAGEVGNHQVLHLAELLRHRRHQQVEGGDADQQQGEQRAEDGDDAALQLQPVLEEGDQRIHQVGDEPGDEEGQQHAAQTLQEHQRADDDNPDDDASDEAVEGDFLAFHDEGCLWVVRLQRLQVAFAAQRFVFGGLAQQHLLVVLHGAVREGGELSALHADGVDFGDLVGDGAQFRHRTEGDAPEVHVQSGDDDPYAVVGKLVAHVHQPVVQKLRFVDAHHVNLRGEQQDACRCLHGGGGDGVAVVRHHVLRRVAGIYGGFEYLHPLLGELRPFQPPEQLFGLSGEHRAADDFDSSPPFGLLYVVF